MKFEIDLDNDHEIKIGAHTIKIRYVEPEHSELEGDFGACVHNEFTIYINKTSPETIKTSTYLHELIHAMEQIYTFKLNHITLNLIAEAYANIFFQKPNIIDKLPEKIEPKEKEEDK